MRPFALGVALALVASRSALAGEPVLPASKAVIAPPASPQLAAPSPLQMLIERFRLFETGGGNEQLATFGSTRSDRLFHLAGDPDSLFTFGDLGGTNGLRVKAAVEMNDVILHAIAPDEKVLPSDTRQRAPGDYRALDGAGRPYQLRLGARLVW